MYSRRRRQNTAARWDTERRGDDDAGHFRLGEFLGLADQPSAHVIARDAPAHKHDETVNARDSFSLRTEPLDPDFHFVTAIHCRTLSVVIFSLDSLPVLPSGATIPSTARRVFFRLPVLRIDFAYPVRVFVCLGIDHLFFELLFAFPLSQWQFPAPRSVLQRFRLLVAFLPDLRLQPFPFLRRWLWTGVSWRVPTLRRHPRVYAPTDSRSHFRDTSGFAPPELHNLVYQRIKKVPVV